MSNRLLKKKSWLALLALLVAVCLPAAAWAQTSAPFPAPVLLPEDSSGGSTGEAGVPYDLSPHEAAMALAFDDNGIARPEWPTPPTITSTCNVTANDETSLNECLDIAGAHIIIPAGDYFGGSSWIIDRPDQWIDMDNGATLHDGVTFSTRNFGANRIKVTGGNFVRGKVQNSGVDDLLIDNVNIFLKAADTDGRDSVSTCSVGSVCHRIAIVNSTCRATIACLFTGSEFGSITSLIVANFDAWSEHTPEGSGNDEYVSRIQNSDRVLIVDSHFRVYPTAKPPQRFHYGSVATLVANNIFEGSGAGFTTFWIDTTAGGPERNDIDNMFIIGNDFYQHDSTKASDINIDDSVGGNGIDVVLVHIEDNVSHHVNTASFTIAGNWNGVGQDCGGRAPCLRNINNTGLIVPGLTLIPFSAGADH